MPRIEKTAAGKVVLRNPDGTLAGSLAATGPSAPLQPVAAPHPFTASAADPDGAVVLLPEAVAEPGEPGDVIAALEVVESMWAAGKGYRVKYSVDDWAAARDAATAAGSPALAAAWVALLAAAEEVQEAEDYNDTIDHHAADECPEAEDGYWCECWRGYNEDTNRDYIVAAVREARIEALVAQGADREGAEVILALSPED